ncbi:MAG: caspase family protein, partial [Thermoguttaceae bacterium]|nr:caspase family protein [Thermoguttaceae bacterium]
MRKMKRRLATFALHVVATTLVALVTVATVNAGDTNAAAGRTIGVKAVAKERRRALIIGVDYFPNLPTKATNDAAEANGERRPSEDYDLACCVTDAQALAAALVEYAGFELENVDVMTFQKGDELDPNDPTVPTAENIRRKIDALAGTLSEEDMLLVAFSGHGVMFGVESNDDPEKRSYLCACDADLDRRSTFVDRKALLETLKKCRAERKLFIADCCRDVFELNEGARGRGRAFGSRSMGAANPFETGNYGFAQISACREGQEALETEGGGLFTSALIDGLRRGANASGELSLTAWFEYAKAQTAERSREILASNPRLGAVDEKTGERQKEQEPTLYLLGETPGWIFADGLPVDGLPGETWAKADELFDEASKIRGRLKSGVIRSTVAGAESARVAAWKKAKARIAEALELTKEAGESSVRRAKYVAEETRLTKWATTEAKRLAEAALEAFKKGEGGDETSVQTAITLMEEALALNDEPGNGYLLTTFKAKLEELQKEPKWTDAPPAGTRKTLEIAGVEYAFRYCPAGAFLMGSPESETGRDSDETQHRIALDGFWMLETEVTVGMWRSFVGATNYKTGDGYGGKGGWGYDVETGKREQNHKYTWENPGFSQTDEHPITQVDYPGAVAFCEWLAKETGEPIRLPT